MDLPNLLNKFKSSQEEVRQFLAIEIANYSVKTAVWQVVGSKTEVVSVGSIQVWESEEEEEGWGEE